MPFRSTVHNTGHVEMVSPHRKDLNSFLIAQTARELTIHYIEEADLRGLADWTRLAELTTELGRLRSLEGIESLPALTSLSIGLGWNRRASLDIEHLEGAQPLEHLAIGIVNPVVGLAPVSKLRKLTGVDMFYKDAKTAARIDEITFDRLPYLEEIRWWSKAEVPPKLNSLQAFASAPNLHKLDLVRTEVTGSLAPFTSCLTSRR